MSVLSWNWQDVYSVVDMANRSLKLHLPVTGLHLLTKCLYLWQIMWVTKIIPLSLAFYCGSRLSSLATWNIVLIFFGNSRFSPPNFSVGRGVLLDLNFVVRNWSVFKNAESKIHFFQLRGPLVKEERNSK